MPPSNPYDSAPTSDIPPSNPYDSPPTGLPPSLPPSNPYDTPPSTLPPTLPPSDIPSLPPASNPYDSPPTGLPPSDIPSVPASIPVINPYDNTPSSFPPSDPPAFLPGESGAVGARVPPPRRTSVAPGPPPDTPPSLPEDPQTAPRRTSSATTGRSLPGRSGASLTGSNGTQAPPRALPRSNATTPPTFNAPTQAPTLNAPTQTTDSASSVSKMRGMFEQNPPAASTSPRAHPRPPPRGKSCEASRSNTLNPYAPSQQEALSKNPFTAHGTAPKAHGKAHDTAPNAQPSKAQPSGEWNPFSPK